MTTTYLDLINRGAKHHGDRTAIVFGDASMTFTEVDELSSQLAHALSALGAKRGASLALLMNNCLYSVPMDFACVKAGINRVPINARLSLPEHVRMLKDTGCATVVFAPDLIERATALKEQIPGLVAHGLGIAIHGGVDLLDEASRQSQKCPQVGIQPTDFVVTLFTSGTTGTLKAAQHTQASYAAACRNIMQNFIDIKPDDSMLHAASLIHASGVFVLPFWMRGARTVIMPGFDPLAYLQVIEQEQITSINMVPTMMQMLLEHSAFDSDSLSSLRHIIYGASPMPRPVIEKAISLLGQHRFWQYFGQTEFPLAIAALRPEDHVPGLLGACGRPSMDVEIRLVDGNGKDVPGGMEGEVVVRGPSMMAGYYNAPALNQEMFQEGGWLRTRDVGVFDERGFLHLKDRTSDMIITGGYNVYPREIEDILLGHPAIAECAVVGLKDPKWVEAVTALVVLKEGFDASEGDLINFVSEQVASYKKPQKVLFVPSIPKTLIGKINRRLIREELSSK
jgi:fatty-acyl-CoA synthase